MKTVCHICQLKMDSAFDDCPQCGTSLANSSSETVILSTAADKFETMEELGTPVVLTLTDKRIIMVDATKEEQSSIRTNTIGGAIIKGAIEGYKAAVDGKTLKLKETTSIQLSDIASFTVEESGFLKRFRLFTILSRDDKTHYTAFGKKTAPEWESEIKRRIG